MVPLHGPHNQCCSYLGLSLFDLEVHVIANFLTRSQQLTLSLDLTWSFTQQVFLTCGPHKSQESLRCATWPVPSWQQLFLAEWPGPAPGANPMLRNNKNIGPRHVLFTQHSPGKPKTGYPWFTVFHCLYQARLQPSLYLAHSNQY